MNKYIIYTTEGYCEDPNGNEVCNSQLLGRVMATDEDEAVENFLKDNSWVLEDGYSPDEFCIAQLHDDEKIY